METHESSTGHGENSGYADADWVVLMRGNGGVHDITNSVVKIGIHGELLIQAAFILHA